MPSELELGRSWWDGVSMRAWQELQGGTGSSCHREGLWVARGGAGALPSPESPSRLEICLLHAGCVTCLPSGRCISAQPFLLSWLPGGCRASV